MTSMNKPACFFLGAVYLCLLTATSVAQETGFDLPKVSQSDFSIASCDFDTAASAMVISDREEIDFLPDENTFNVFYTRCLKMKILQEDGVRFARLEIPLYTSAGGRNGMEELREIEAFTYNFSEGKLRKTKLDRGTIYTEKLSDHYNLKKMTFPDVRPGSVIVVRYMVVSPFKFNLNDWYFQAAIPVAFSECTLKYTPFYLYTYMLKNASRFDEFQEDKLPDQELFNGATYNKGICRFVMKNLPAFTETDFISSKEQYVVRLHFQLNKTTNTQGISTNRWGTWQDLIKDLKEEDGFGGYLSSARSAAKDLPGFGDHSLSTVTDFRDIVKWVKAELSWNGMKRFVSNSKVKEVLKRKTGSSAEINLFLCGMLQTAGIHACPVLISTRGNAQATRDYPNLSSFNYVVVGVDVAGKWILTDATEPLLQSDALPFICFNGPALLIDEKQLSWIEISPVIKSSTEQRIRLALTGSADSLKCRIETVAKGYPAFILRKELGNDPEKIMRYYSGQGMAVVDSIFVRNSGIDSLTQPMVVGMQCLMPVEMTGSDLVINPFTGLALKKNPFPRKTRRNPVDMIYTEKWAWSSELTISPGFRVKKMPESVQWEHDQLSFTFTSQLTDNLIRVSAAFSFKKPVFPAEDYLKLQEYFSEILSRLNDKIYLEKL